MQTHKCISALSGIFIMHLYIYILMYMKERTLYVLFNAFQVYKYIYTHIHIMHNYLGTMSMAVPLIRLLSPLRQQ